MGVTVGGAGQRERARPERHRTHCSFKCGCQASLRAAPTLADECVGHGRGCWGVRGTGTSPTGLSARGGSGGWLLEEGGASAGRGVAAAASG
eukprot:2027449-Rhodomonas_salina.2